MLEQPTWVMKYIQESSILGKTVNMTQFAKKENISRQNIYAYLAKHPEVHDLVRKNIKNQYNVLSIKAHNSLLAMMKTNPKALQIALEICQDYTPKQDVTNRYHNMDKDQLEKDASLKLKKLFKKNKIDL